MSFTSLCASRSLTPDAVHVHSKLRRNSLVSDVEDIALLREKLTRIAVGRLRGALVRRAEAIANEADGAEEAEEAEEADGAEEETARMCGSGCATQHFRGCSLLLPERSSTPPSSPQPRDVLKKQLKLKQHVADRRMVCSSNRAQQDDGGDEALVSVDDGEVRSMDDSAEDDAVASPSWSNDKTNARARLSTPAHVRILSPFNVFHKHPEGVRKRKCVDAPHDALADDSRVSLKKTSSQINILVTSTGTLSRSSSTGQGFLQTFAARQRLEQDHDMEDTGCTTQPQSPQNAHFGSKHGQLSACS